MNGSEYIVDVRIKLNSERRVQYITTFLYLFFIFILLFLSGSWWVGQFYFPDISSQLLLSSAILLLALIKQSPTRKTLFMIQMTAFFALYGTIIKIRNETYHYVDILDSNPATWTVFIESWQVFCVHAEKFSFMLVNQSFSFVTNPIYRLILAGRPNYTLCYPNDK